MTSIFLLYVSVACFVVAAVGIMRSIWLSRQPARGKLVDKKIKASLMWSIGIIVGMATLMASLGAFPIRQ